LPLPAKTGQAIVDYLRKGRPATSTSRALFVRHIAPLDKPIGASIVRAAVRGAYLRSGWPYSQGTHVLRHSTASRLLQTGTPLKQIADILRHRSVDTTLIYTKVDINKLATVAMPWPRRRP
jgi:integrase/recombinase XerD